jgi:hypothetical protein
MTKTLKRTIEFTYDELLALDDALFALLEQEYDKPEQYTIRAAIIRRARNKVQDKLRFL